MAHAASLFDFLNHVLSQRGHGSLPYADDLRYVVREHVLELVQRYRSLETDVSAFTHNDGRTALLLRCKGTLPVAYQGVTYNIPVALWLPEAYPRAPPLVFVMPTADMVVKANHALCDASGLVSTAQPPLARWTFPSHTLVGLAAALAEAFGRDPPLYSRGPRPQPPPPQAAHAQAQAQQAAVAAQQRQLFEAARSAEHERKGREAAERSHAAQAAALAAHAARLTVAPGGPGPAGWQQAAPHTPAAQALPAQPPPPRYGHPVYSPPHAQQPPPPPVPPPPPPPPPMEPPETQFRARALTVLLQRGRAALAAASAAEGESVSALLETQGVLETRRRALAAAAQPARAERDGLEHHTLALREAAAALEGWLAENEGRVPAVVDADAAVVPQDAWARQALEAAAEDAAAEDAMYALGRALEAQTVPLPEYLRAVRVLCREQFFARATALVVASARVSAGSARPL